MEGRRFPRAWAAMAVAVAVLLALGAVRDLRAVAQAPDFTLPTTGLEGRGPLGADAKAGEAPPPGSVGAAGLWTLSEHRNRTVVLDFMAVTCTSCRLVTAQVLRPLWAEFGGREDFAIVSIDAWADSRDWPGLGENMTELAALQREEGLPWPHLLDVQRVYKAYGAAALPKVVVVDGGGRIVYEAQGIPDAGRVRAAVVESLAGEGSPQLVVRVGGAAFLAPCSIGLMPAYLGLLMRQRQAGALRGGLSAAAGMVAAYAVLAGLLALAGAAGLGARMRAGLPWAGVAVAGLMVAVGAAALLGLAWRAPLRLLPAVRGRAAAPASAVAAGGAPGNMAAAGVSGPASLAGFGAAYAVAGFACTGPLLLPILLGASLEGWAVGLGAMAAYALAVALLAVAVAAAVEAGRPWVAGLARRARAVQVATGAVLVASGAWLLLRDLGALL